MRDTFQKICEVIRKQVPTVGQITADAELVKDLGADSLDMMHMVCDLEDVFDVEIPEEDAQQIKTVRDAVRLMERLQAEQ
jgi:acyl carrier protein